MRLKTIISLKYFMIFAVFFGMTFLLSIKLLVSENKEIKIPDFRDKPWSEVTKELAKSGLKGRVQTTVFDFFAPENMVLSQSISPNEIVMEGREIHFEVSGGRDPDWKDQIKDQSWFSAQQYLAKQGVTYFQKFHVCRKNPSGNVIDVTWDENQKQMNLLIEDQECGNPWILKSLDKGRYMNAFEKDIRQKGMDIRIIGAYKDNDRIQTDPVSGSVVEKGDFIIIRNES